MISNFTTFLIFLFLKKSPFNTPIYPELFGAEVSVGPKAGGLLGISIQQGDKCFDRWILKDFKGPSRQGVI